MRRNRVDPSETAAKNKMKKFRIMVGTPCYGGMVAEKYLMAMFKTVANCMGLGVDLYLHAVSNQSLVTRARNEIVASFLASDCTHLFFIDADIGWKPEDFIAVLLHDREVVGGVYRMKCDEPRYTLNLSKMTINIENGLAEAERIGTGFLCIQRSVFEKMMAEYPHMKYVSKSDILSEKEKEFCYTFFDTEVDRDGVYWSEDFAFCNRWKALGGKIYFNPYINLDHMGSYVFKGDFTKQMSTRIVTGKQIGRAHV